MLAFEMLFVVIICLLITPIFAFVILLLLVPGAWGSFATAFMIWWMSWTISEETILVLTYFAGPVAIAYFNRDISRDKYDV